MVVKIMICGCKSEFQDKRYGAQQHVHNSGKDLGKDTSYRCTVCGTVKK